MPSGNMPDTSNHSSGTDTNSRPMSGKPHYDPVSRQGRAASLVLDDDGHIAYPSEVPPAVESPAVGVDTANDYFLSEMVLQRTGTTTMTGMTAMTQSERASQGLPRSESATVLHDLAMEREPRPPSAASERGSSESRRSPGLDLGPVVAPPRRARFLRSSTMPLPARGQTDEFVLFHEMRRTSTINWNAVDDDSDLEDGATGPFFSSGGAGLIRRGLHEHIKQQNEREQKRQQSQEDQQGQHEHVHGHDHEQQAQPPFSGGQFWRKRVLRKPDSHEVQEDPGGGQTFRRDGRLPISVRDTSHTGYLAKAVGAAVRKMTARENGVLSDLEGDVSTASTFAAGDGKATAAMSPVERLLLQRARRPCPRLNIVIMVIGSRGDAQPFLKIGKVLKEQYGHRVRIATHPAFRDFIEKDAGLEFFSVGGDPAELMAFMVKNPGMIPSLESVKAGDIGRRRAMMAELFQGFWRACVEATDDPTDMRNRNNMGEREPFVADAIIANPPSFAHTHCAEALGIPLHMMFTFPYTPTQAFPHPLAIIKQSDVDLGYTNFMSYLLVDMMVWQGLGDLVNDLRVKTLGLDPVSRLWAPGSAYRMQVPFTYLWSPGLVPKPSDWGPEIDISGFVFLELAASFAPPRELEAFLAASPEPPVYIGFGSIVVDDADRFTEMIFAAVKLAGVRALVSKGWGGLGGGQGGAVPEDVFMLENTPHDWLFPQVRACVIHGGAGTTAIALKCGLPTMVVPFFGDQYFWGSMIEKSGVGPKPVPYKQLTAERLAEGIRQCLGAEARQAAQAVAESIAAEGDGALNACRSFHRTLRLEGLSSMRCAIFPDRIAVWQSRRGNMRLGAAAVELLVQEGQLSYGKLRLLRNTEWNDFEGPGEPISAIFGALAKSIQDGLPFGAAEAQWRRKREEQRARKRERKMARNSGGRASEVGDEAVALLSAMGYGASKTAKALVLAPIELWFSICQGFHNAPRLYGDDTVRQTPRVTGIKSGLRAAGRELVLGVYDGVTGLVLLPVRHTRNGGGMHGFVSGLGMGVMGFCLKGIAAVIGPIGYAVKGLAREMEKTGRSTKGVRRARIAQGQREVLAMDGKTRRHLTQQAVAGWETMQALYEAVQGGGKKWKKGGGESGNAEEGRGREGRVREDRGKGHHRHPSFLPNRALDAALESADVAAVALAAVRRGETLESVMGRRSYGHAHNHHYERHQHRKSLTAADGGRRSEGDKHKARKVGQEAGQMPQQTVEIRLDGAAISEPADSTATDVGEGSSADSTIAKHPEVVLAREGIVQGE
ncbi:udp-transferase [Grosmannia clavigera kw1407]|uniref:Udp-transferase n=1 Tax=Grosmannia clavigera (strain kw1407 / UAMH 11150) TaxID=655863 RepID=F0XS87_GROCL|nr:udp-transferase [Grosmannia clavigera kw1407]EFW99411.1 udp-transferase [Grosmannia clavigera kw1407]